MLSPEYTYHFCPLYYLLCLKVLLLLRLLKKKVVSSSPPLSCDLTLFWNPTRNTKFFRIIKAWLPKNIFFFIKVIKFLIIWETTLFWSFLPFFFLFSFYYLTDLHYFLCIQSDKTYQGAQWKGKKIVLVEAGWSVTQPKSWTRCT